jgi:hypothetical protein
MQRFLQERQRVREFHGRGREMAHFPKGKQAGTAYAMEWHEN